MDEPTHRIVVDLSKPPKERVKTVTLKAAEKTAIKKEWEANENHFDRYADRITEQAETLIKHTIKEAGYKPEKLTEYALVDDNAKALLAWKLNTETLVEKHLEQGKKEDNFIDSLPPFIT